MRVIDESKSAKLLLTVAVAIAGPMQMSCGNVGIWAPVSWTQPNTNTLYPFLIQQVGWTNHPSMRYQQVYNSSFFRNLGSSIYLKTLLFPAIEQAPNPIWTVPNMQINLSTTTKSAADLSPVFSENVGPDDQIVFGPGSHTFSPSSPDGFDSVLLERSFRFDPNRGNLLLDVRVFDGGPFEFFSTGQPSLMAFNSPTSQVLRAWSTNVMSTVAEAIDTTGLVTGLLFTPDSFSTVPSPRGAETWTQFPLLIRQTYSPTNAPVSMHYQQVYSSSLFTNLDPSLIYITSLTFLLESPYTNKYFTWTNSNIRISLSTTTNQVAGLSPFFSKNIGSDEVAVLYGPVVFGLNLNLPVTAPDGPLPVYFNTPFRYNPARGNLLLDVQLSDMAGPDYTIPDSPFLEGFNAPTNLVSRAWSTNVMASTADALDGTGLTTIFEFSPVPSLTATFSPVDYDGQTNMIDISWPSQPSIFQLQWAEHFGPNTVWSPATNQILGSSQTGGRAIRVPAASAGAQGIYRLIWPNGQ